MKKTERKIIKIDENLCNGCGLCVPSCPEQALQVIETPAGKKARLVKEFFCDGLGACLGSCPTGALVIENAMSEPYDEESTIARIREVAPEMLDTHLKHLKEHEAELPAHHGHQADAIASCGCPGAKAMHWGGGNAGSPISEKTDSELRQWPIQLQLVQAGAPNFKSADLVVVADCVPFAYADFHKDFLKRKTVVIACPKLDDVDPYVEKLAAIFKQGKPASLIIVHMEVPCCFGLTRIVDRAIEASGEKIDYQDVTISIKGAIIG